MRHGGGKVVFDWPLCADLQSTRHVLVRWYREWLNPDPVKRPFVYKWTKALLTTHRGPGACVASPRDYSSLFHARRLAEYNFDTAPDALNTWFIFRLVTDLVLGHDLGSYVLVLVMHWEWPQHFTFATVLLCALLLLFLVFAPPMAHGVLFARSYIIGFSFAAFAAWAKHDAYRVIKDYAWYWGDFFFTVTQSLNFDRVFALSPHPMYTIG